MTERINKSGGIEREAIVATLAEAEAIAKAWRVEGFRVGTSSTWSNDAQAFRVFGRMSKANQVAR